MAHTRYDIKFRRVYTNSEIVFINEQVQDAIEKYTEYYAVGLKMNDIAKDTAKAALAHDILKLGLYNGLVYGQTTGIDPKAIVQIIRTNLPIIYCQDVLLNPALLQD